MENLIFLFTGAMSTAQGVRISSQNASMIPTLWKRARHFWVKQMWPGCPVRKQHVKFHPLGEQNVPLETYSSQKEIHLTKVSCSSATMECGHPSAPWEQTRHWLLANRLGLLAVSLSPIVCLYVCTYMFACLFICIYIHRLRNEVC